MKIMRKLINSLPSARHLLLCHHFFSAFRGFNDSVKKKKAARLSSSILSRDVQNLYYILTFPIIQGEAWTNVTDAVKQLAECLHGYVEHLEAENMKQKTHQSSLEPVRSPLKNFDVHEIESVIPVRGEYLALNSKIEEDGEYEAIHLDEKFLPVDK